MHAPVEPELLPLVVVHLDARLHRDVRQGHVGRVVDLGVADDRVKIDALRAARWCDARNGASFGLIAQRAQGWAVHLQCFEALGHV